MDTVYQLLGVVGAALIVWVIYRQVRGRPEQFSKEKLTQSFSSMGVLALLLIAFVGFLVYLTRS